MPIPWNFNAPYTGGVSPGGRIFAVDGNFTQADPTSAPRISYPFEGDSVFSNRSAVFKISVPTLPDLPAFNFEYDRIPYGTAPNIQLWSANQVAIVLEQDFMVAQSSYRPMRLNTHYSLAWSVGWAGAFVDGVPSVDLRSLILVKEGELQDMGGGLSKITRKWATIPPTRNMVESFGYTFIGMDFGDKQTRLPQNHVVNSRVQHDYFVFDDFEILAIPIFPAGNKLNAGTGLYPPGLLFEEQRYFAGENALEEVTHLVDDNPSSGALRTMPSLGDYLTWIGGTDDNPSSEIIAEASSLNRWMGNIFERRTRFILAQ